jgi:hypothetical protein
VLDTEQVFMKFKHDNVDYEYKVMKTIAAKRGNGCFLDGF